MSDMFIEFADLTSETSNWHKVASRYTYRDRYGRPVRDYIVDSDGNRIAVGSCAFNV